MYLFYRGSRAIFFSSVSFWIWQACHNVPWLMPSPPAKGSHSIHFLNWQKKIQLSKYDYDRNYIFKYLLSCVWVLFLILAALQTISIGSSYMDVHLKKKEIIWCKGLLRLLRLPKPASFPWSFFPKGQFDLSVFLTECQFHHSLTTADEKPGRYTLPSNNGQIFLQHMIPPLLVYWPSAVSSTNSGMPQVTRKRM